MGGYLNKNSSPLPMFEIEIHVLPHAVDDPHSLNLFYKYCMELCNNWLILRICFCKINQRLHVFGGIG